MITEALKDKKKEYFVQRIGSMTKKNCQNHLILHTGEQVLEKVRLGQIKTYTKLLLDELVRF